MRLNDQITFTQTTEQPAVAAVVVITHKLYSMKTKSQPNKNVSHYETRDNA